jgi:phosphatidylinositol alpha-1,6-mannosyltransferase
MRVLITTEQYPPETGGIGAIARGFAVGLSRRGHEVAVLSTHVLHRELTEDADGIPVAGAGWASRLRFVKLPFISRAVHRLYNRFLPDVIFASSYRPTALAARYALRRYKVPMVIYVHGTELLTENINAPRRYLIRKTYAHSALLIANSETTKRHISEVYGTDLPTVAVVHPGVDIGRFPLTPEPEGPPTILSVSHMTRRKGGDILLEAVAWLRRSAFPDLRLILCGDGTFRPELEALANRLGLVGDAIEWTGEVSPDTIPALMRRCTVFALPSRPAPEPYPDFGESFGIVYIEAGATGRAVVGTRVGGIHEAVRDEITGFLVEPESPGALAEALARLLSDGQLRQAMALAGRQRAEEIDWKLQAEKFESLLSNLKR